MAKAGKNKHSRKRREYPERGFKHTKMPRPDEEELDPVLINKILNQK